MFFSFLAICLLTLLSFLQHIHFFRVLRACSDFNSRKRLVSDPLKRAHRMTASGKIRWRFFPKSNTAPKEGMSFPPWLTTRPSVLRMDSVNFLDTASKNTEAARKSTSSELISEQGCSSKEILRARRRIASIISGPARRLVDPSRT